MLLQALLAQQSPREACAGCAPPGSLGQMPCVPAEPDAIAGTTHLLVLLSRAGPCAPPAVELRESGCLDPPKVLKTDNDATPAQQRGKESTFIEPLLCARHPTYILTSSNSTVTMRQRYYASLLIEKLRPTERLAIGEAGIHFVRP